MLPWVDHIFGTYHVPKAQWPVRYGTATPVAAGWAEQLIDPLMPIRQQTGAPLNGAPKTDSEAIPTSDGELV
jgi:hypothetical protein